MHTTPNSFDCCSVELFVTFWTLSLYDINCPKATYEAEIQRKKTEIAAVASGVRQGAQTALASGDPESSVCVEVNC